MSAKKVKRLRKIAKELDAKTIPLPSARRVVLSGQELIDRGTTQDEESTPIDPKKRYHSNEKTTVNHDKQLQKAYKEGGLEAVMNYVHNTHAASAELKKFRTEKAKAKLDEMAKPLEKPEIMFNPEPAAFI